MAEYAPKSRNLFQKEEIVAKFLNAVFDFDYTGRQVFNMSHNEIIQTIYNLLHYESIMEHVSKKYYFIFKQTVCFIESCCYRS